MPKAIKLRPSVCSRVKIQKQLSSEQHSTTVEKIQKQLSSESPTKSQCITLLFREVATDARKHRYSLETLLV